MSLLFFAEPARTMTEPWFAPRSSFDMDDFFPQALARQHSMRAQARSQVRAERARRQRLEAQRREAIAARVMAIEAARRHAMQQEYEWRQRKALALRHQQKQRRQEQQCLRALHRQKQRQLAIQGAMDRHHRDFDLEDWPLGLNFLPSELEHILGELLDHQRDPEPKVEFYYLKPEYSQEDDQSEGPSPRRIKSNRAEESVATEPTSEAGPIQKPTEPGQAAQVPSNVEPQNEAPVQSKAEPQGSQAEIQLERQTLLFHPFTPSLKRNPAAVNASKIQVDVKDNRVTVSGLWSLENPSNNRRSLSPRSKARASHVRDVDENGDEILLPHDTDDSDSDASKSNVLPSTVTKTVDLPAGLTADCLHSDLNDQGFFLWTA